MAEYKQAGETKQEVVRPAGKTDLSVSKFECAEVRRRGQREVVALLNPPSRGWRSTQHTRSYILRRSVPFRQRTDYERPNKVLHSLFGGTGLGRCLRTLLQTSQRRLIAPPTQQPGVERARGAEQEHIQPHDEPGDLVSVATDTPEKTLLLGGLFGCCSFCCSNVWFVAWLVE